MEIHPLKNQIYLKLDEVRAGVLDTSSRMTAVESAEVLGVGEGIDNIKKGDRVFVKAWALDNVDYKGQKYVFCNLETNGILAIINE